MSNIKREQDEQRFENQQIVEALLSDGSDPAAIYELEHHFSCNNFDRLEKFAVEAFKQGFDVSDAEELELDDGAMLFACDLLTELPLELEQINSQTDKMVELAHSKGVAYDGWGTHFIEQYDEDELDD